MNRIFLTTCRSSKQGFAQGTAELDFELGNLPLHVLTGIHCRTIFLCLFVCFTSPEIACESFTDFQFELYIQTASFYCLVYNPEQLPYYTVTKHY